MALTWRTWRMINSVKLSIALAVCPDTFRSAALISIVNSGRPGGQRPQLPVDHTGVERGHQAEVLRGLRRRAGLTYGAS
ncbi:hypothetical protein AB0F11_30060 [Streptomyces sp. NPDC032472]|uniref:hypothetical protein n=1 Tax=Streptomyces sp. NPDC032472 TaxID=3155018 RepID=UPI00340D124B